MHIEKPIEENVSAKTASPVEIHEVRALRVDANGRAVRLRVLGVVDRIEQHTHVDVCVAELTHPSGWEDQGATTYARLVDPARTFVGYRKPVFHADLHKPEDERRRAYMWIAEVDVLLPVAVPPIIIGQQTVPVNVRARMFANDLKQGEAVKNVLELKSVVEFDAGVLFVHGIGKQRRAETLSQWSAPLARWINAWLKGATDEIAVKLSGKPLGKGKPEGPPEPVGEWRDTLVNRKHYDPDSVDRAMYASGLARKVESRAVKERAAGDWRPETRAAAAAKPAEQPHVPTGQEAADCKKVEEAINRLGASAVGGTAEFREAYVLDVGAHSFEPSSVEMHIEAMAADGYMLRTRWMVAESFWAETFWAPSFFGFGRWCLLTAPVVLVHYIALARLQHRNVVRWFLAAAGLTLGLTVAQLAFLLLMVLWLVPWERVRNAVLKVQLGLAGIVGDAYVLLQDPVQRRAILDRVQRDLNWLLQRCRKVVVVAHSQGAAVAEIVLSNREGAGAEDIESFVTLGSGVQTLTAIEENSRKFRVNLAGWLAIAAAYALAVAVALLLLGFLAAGAGLFVLLLLGFWFVASEAVEAHGGRPLYLPRAAWSRSWFDFFATKDLVPYGPLLDSKNAINEKMKHYKPKEVRNRDSLFGDHVLYWQNPEQVVGPVAREIGAAAGFKPLTDLLPNDDDVMKRLERARLSRLDFLGIGRAVAYLATAILLYKLWPAVAAIGFWAIVWLQSKIGLAPGALPAPGLRVWLQAALILVPFIVYKTLINATFDAWTTGEVERLLRRSAAYPATHWAFLFAGLVVLTLAGPIFYVWPASTWIVLGAAVIGLILVLCAMGVHLHRVDPEEKSAVGTAPDSKFVDGQGST